MCGCRHACQHAHAGHLFVNTDVLAMNTAIMSAQCMLDHACFTQVLPALPALPFLVDGSADFSLCMQVDDCLEAPAVLGQILASMTQAKVRVSHA
jgi:hypothetical protein